MDGGGGGGGGFYTCHYTVTTRLTPALKKGEPEKHFKVSVGSDGQSHETVSPSHNLFEEKGEPKRYRTEVLPLTSLTPYRSAKPAHIIMSDKIGGALFILFLPGMTHKIGRALLIWCFFT